MHAAAPFDADKFERLLFRAEFSGGPRYGEIWGDMGRYGEIALACHGEIWGDLGR